MTSDVFFWWYSLCGIAALNVIAWTSVAAFTTRRQGTIPGDAYAMCRLQMVLSGVYVFGCAFRSALPVFDVPRLVLFDSVLSNVIVGRSVATLAELCFVGQWALLLSATARVTGAVTARIVSKTVVPLIVIAEVCSWNAVLTTSNLGHVIEESLWGVSAALLAISMMGIWPRCPRTWRPALVAACFAAVAYVFYMFLVDVPTYWSRWVADEASGRQYLSIVQGIRDVSSHRVVSHQWQDWRSEIVWMSLYFSVAVWISIWLILVSYRQTKSFAGGKLRRSKLQST